MLQKVGYASEGSNYTARKRHLIALDEAQQALRRTQALINERSLGELVAEELRQVHEALGTIAGEVTADDLLGEIFSSFCLGK